MSEPLPSNPPAAEWLDMLLSYLWERRGTDLHLAAGSEPMVRVDGDLRSVPGQPILKPVDTDAIVVDLPDPVGPVTRMRPDGASTICCTASGRPSSFIDGMSDGIIRSASVVEPRWA